MPDVCFNFFGRDSEKYEPITPEILTGYDVVITIGKTVQYALGMGIPVYNYDKFGGSGYITLKNFEKEEFHNFSGRSYCRRLTAEDIAKELSEQYTNTLQQAPELRRKAINNYLLSTHIDEIMQKLKQAPDTKITQSGAIKMFLQYCSFIITHYEEYWRNFNNFKKRTDTLTQNCAELQKRLQKYERYKKYRKKYRRYKTISFILSALLLAMLVSFVYLWYTQ